LKLSALQFQPEFIRVSWARKSAAGSQRAFSWSHPGDASTSEDLLLLVQSTEMRQEQDYFQQLLTTAGTIRIIIADTPGRKQSLQRSLMYKHCKLAKVLMFIQACSLTHLGSWICVLWKISTLLCLPSEETSIACWKR